MFVQVDCSCGWPGALLSRSRTHNEGSGLGQYVARKFDARTTFPVNLVSEHTLEMKPALKPFRGYIPIFPAMAAGNLSMFSII
jgi:hypothetical protein